MTGYLAAPPGAIMVLMCHISHRRYREDVWSRGGWTWIEEADQPKRRDPDLRVSQAERDEVVAALAGHFADGRLTVEEYEERVEAALASRIGRDLEPLLADLPAADPPPASTRSRRRLEPGSVRAPLIPARLLAVAAVVVLAIATGPWALWLLWPALVFTGGCGFGRRHGRVRADFRARATPEPPPVVQRL
ncbi:MAG: DUF1707 SHOCT-like domain-containing protein [Acidimicrobiales bacterium]